MKIEKCLHPFQNLLSQPWGRIETPSPNDSFKKLFLLIKILKINIASIKKQFRNYKWMKFDSTSSALNSAIYSTNLVSPTPLSYPGMGGGRGGNPGYSNQKEGKNCKLGRKEYHSCSLNHIIPPLTRRLLVPLYRVKSTTKVALLSCPCRRLSR